MIAEWTRAQCSMLGAWGAASFTGQLTQLRALDWDTDGPFQQWPTLVVYHPDAATGGVPNAVLGWAGMLGAITGVSSAGVGISEKVWDAYKGTDNPFGCACYATSTTTDDPGCAHKPGPDTRNRAPLDSNRCVELSLGRRAYV